MNPKKRFLYACGSAIFSFIIVMVILSFLPLNKEMSLAILIGLTLVTTVVSYIYPKIGYNVTKFFIGWASVLDPGGLADPNLPNKLANNTFDEEFELMPNRAVLFIIAIIFIGLMLWRFPQII